MDSMTWKHPLAVRPGESVYYADSKGRPSGAEGWLRRQAAPRDEGAQRDVAGHLPGFDAAHLIPASLGGVGSHSNLVPMPAVLNRSYVRAVENMIARHLVHAEVFMRVEVSYIGEREIPTTILHQAFLLGAGGQLRPIPNGEVATSIHQTPGVAMGRVVRPRDFLSSDPFKGVANRFPI